MGVFRPVEKSLCLQHVCEANYERLLRLVPDLLRIPASATARVPGKPDLHLTLLERSPFTLVLELTHDFAAGFAALAEPAVRIRVCLDACTVEMLSDHVRSRVHEALRDELLPEAVLDYKWSLNYFLMRWLDHCLASRYRFCPGVADLEKDLVSA